MKRQAAAPATLHAAWGTAWLDQAGALADLIEQENALLEAMDLARAAALLDRKRAGLAALERTRSGSDASPDPEGRQTLRRLADAAARNKRLLERAIQVQGQVIAILARAIPPAPAARRYGQPAPSRQVAAFALRASA